MPLFEVSLVEQDHQHLLLFVREVRVFEVTEEEQMKYLLRYLQHDIRNEEEYTGIPLIRDSEMRLWIVCEREERKVRK
jgi:hypothetical protein